MSPGLDANIGLLRVGSAVQPQPMSVPQGRPAVRAQFGNVLRGDGPEAGEIGHKRLPGVQAVSQKHRDRYRRLMGMLTEENLQNLQDRLRAAFPGDVYLDDIDVVSTLSFGPSFGYVHENALHLDLFGVETYCTMEELPYVICLAGGLRSGCTAYLTGAQYK